MYKFEKAYFNDNINLLDPLICFLGEEANDVNRLSCNLRCLHVFCVDVFSSLSIKILITIIKIDY